MIKVFNCFHFLFLTYEECILVTRPHPVLLSALSCSSHNWLFWSLCIGDYCGVSTATWPFLSTEVQYYVSFHMYDIEAFEILPPSRNIRSWRVQTQKIIVRGNDFYTPHFTLPTNSPSTHQPHSILSNPSWTLYFGTKFEPSRILYFGTEGVLWFLPFFGVILPWHHK
jgi:hypothetical protein